METGFAEYLTKLEWSYVHVWVALVVLMVSLLVYYTYWIQDNRRRFNLPGPFPLPIIGITHEIMKKGLGEFDLYAVRKYGKLVALNGSGRIGDIIVADLDVLKEIMVKQSSSFTDRNEDPGPMFEPLNKALTLSKGEHWKQMRSTITPAFSAGKLKQMDPLIAGCAGRLVQNLKKKAKKDEKFDAKSLFNPFTMDVIASTGFGIQLDSQSNEDDPFVRNAKELMSPSLNSPAVLVILFFPYLMKFLKPLFVYFDIAMVRALKFFVNATDQITEQRMNSSTGQKHHDVLQLMLDSHTMSIQKAELSDDEKEVSTWKKKALTRDEMAGNEILFLIAGYDTTALTLTHASYLLATHPDVQDKLQHEIDDQLQGSDPTYENVKNLPYLEQVLLETLRLYPPGIRVDRVATEDVVVKGLRIPKGTTCVVPIKAVHRDPDVWPEPDRFDPDRFTPEAKANRNPFAFLGFGMGPRNCIGMRLAKLEIKVALVKMMQNFTLKTCEETPVTIKMQHDKPNRSEKDIILKVEERSK